MRIVIDMQGVQGGSRQRGIGRYSKSFIEAFIRQNKGHEIFIFINMLLPEAALLQETYTSVLPRKHIIPFYGVGPVREVYPSNMWNLRASELIREKMLADLKPDFVIVTSLFEGLTDNSIVSIGSFSHIPTASILYDLIPSIYPEQFLQNPLKKTWYERKLRSLNKSDILLSISDSAAQEAIKYLNFNPKDIYTVFAASNIDSNTLLPRKTVEEKYHIDKPFLLHSSAYEPRKNFEGLIKAYANLSPDLRQQYQLVLVCKLKEKERQKLEETIAEAKLTQKDVILTGYVDDATLIALYHYCYLFVFPSLHEGFGLPPLEAMSCGAAAIASNLSSIPEVIGREDALFDPYSTESITEKITEVLTQKTFWHALKEHAKEQASRFSWDKTAKKALCALETAHKNLPEKRETNSILENTQTLIKHIAALKVNDIRPLDSNLMQAAQAITYNEETLYRHSLHQNSHRPLWCIEGPFDSSYSLALLNRETALTLSALGYKVLLHSTDGNGDFEPNKVFLQENPLLAELYRNTFYEDAAKCRIASRNLYPPRVSDMHTPIKMLHHYAWEESAFPEEWTDSFNTNLSAMTCLSTHVEKIMIDNGVTVPLSVSGCGVDHWEKIEPDSSYRLQAKRFRFLHVSSCFPRKGVDVLLKSYGDAFTNTDDVTLIIKTFANPHNKVHQWLKEAKTENPHYPDVIIIEEDLTDAQLKALYEVCHTLVAPSRAEGFGLPLAEAMLSGLPVITTAWGGQLDFCTKETAWLTDYTFTQAKTHFELFNSVWAEPSRTHLAKQMSKVYALPQTERSQKAAAGRKILLKKFTWKTTVEKLIDAAATLPNDQALANKPKVGWITSWNTRCGIASYAKHLIDAMPQKPYILASETNDTIQKDLANVYRCWQTGDGNRLERLNETIDTLQLDTLLIQFNYSFFDFIHFSSFLETQLKKNRTVILMMHATSDAPSTAHKKLSMLVPALKKCDRIFVHTANDLNRLKSLGLVENVSLFPHGIPDIKKNSIAAKNKIFTLATYGFFLPHKGLLQMIEAVNILKSKGMNVKLKMINAAYPVPQSAALIEAAKERIDTLGLQQTVTLQTEYLSDEACLKELSSADLVVFPYQETGESSSAAVRYAIASGTVVATTPLKIFDDVEAAVFKLSGTGTEAMAKSLAYLISQIKKNSHHIQTKHKSMLRWSKAHSYTALGKRIHNICMALSHLKS